MVMCCSNETLPLDGVLEADYMAMWVQQIAHNTGCVPSLLVCF